MQLDLSSVSGGEYPFSKHFFNLKTQKNDGLILQVHHSYNDLRGENKKYNFIHASFSDPGTHLAVADHKGHIFVIDLDSERYWKLPDVGLPSVISFPVLKKHELLIGLDTTSILFVNIETCTVIGVLNGHLFPVTEISYSDNGYYYLTSCSAEAIIWDSSSLTQIHKLSLKSEATLKKALFMPVTNHILACFQNDTIHIWKFSSFECIKQIVPETWKTHHLKAIALTKDGKAMVVGGHTPNIVIFCLDKWIISKVVEFPEHISGVKQMEFVSQVFDGGENKILTILTTSLEIFFFDIETSVFLRGMHHIFGIAVKFALSPNGKYLASILSTGDFNIYVIEKILLNRKQLADFNENNIALQKSSSNYQSSRNYSNNSRKTQKSNESISSIQRQIKDILDVKKLKPILKQFGEYPQSYRLLIWKTILEIPVNQESFISLAVKKCHPSYIKLESKYPLVNKSLCNSLKKLLSNLSHWCPLFGEVDFLPEFVFPFVKLFHSDPLACFEVIATVIVNWCQNWFEFYPFPPINMLSVMENILGHHDPNLLEFYLKNNITASISICPLFHTAFSEVLSKTQWLKLWDHILTNEPSFFFMAIIAYNIVCRNAIKNFQDVSELEKFFHKQNPVDMKMLISKTYYLLKETPDEIHSRRFFSQFRPLSCGGTYISFLAYPKLIIDSSAEKLQSIRKEEEEILEEQLKALSIKKKLDKKLKSEYKNEDQEKIYQDIEEKISKIVEEEEDRILTQRQKLQNLRQELRLKELEVLEETRDKALKDRLKKKEIEFERLLKDISKRKVREKMEIDIIEDEIRKYYSELLLRKCQLELELGCKVGEDNVRSRLDLQTQKLKNDLLELQNDWGSLHQNKRIEFCNKTATIKALIQDLEAEVAKEIAEKDSEKKSQGKQKIVEKLRKKVNILENEIEELLVKNLNQLQQQKEKKTVTLYSPTKHKLPQSRNKENTPSHNSSVQDCFNSITKNKNKKFERAKTRRSMKTFSKKIAPGVRKVTMTRTRNPKPKLKECRKTKKEENTYFKNSERDSDAKTALPKFRPRHFKSKFTCPSENKQLSPDSSDICEHLDCEIKSSDSESYENKKSHQQPKGDFEYENKEGAFHKIRKSKKKDLSKFTIKQDTSSEKTGSEDEIFNSALRVRKQLIKEARMRQNLQ